MDADDVLSLLIGLMLFLIGFSLGYFSWAWTWLFS